MNQKTSSEVPCWIDDFMVGLPMPAGGYYVIPWGALENDNYYSHTIRDLTKEHGIVQGILAKKHELLWGEGPQLYQTKFVNGSRRKQWIKDDEIEKWLNSWNYLEYIEKAMAEFLLLNGYFTKFHCISQTFTRFAVSKLEFVNSDLCRLQYTGDHEPITGVITGDFLKPGLFGYNRLPVFDPQNPRAYKEAITFESIFQSGVEYYPRSPVHGSLSWIKAGAQTAKSIGSFNANSISPKYHIEVPALYWEKLRDKLMLQCIDKGIQYTEAMLVAAKDQTFEEVSNTLAGTDKAGKFLVTDQLFDEVRMKYVGWKITPLETNSRDYLTAQMNVAHESQFYISSGLGMHPALTGITKSGGLSTGSEFEYAAKLYRAISTEISERIILKNINLAIAINFPGISTKIGFDHDGI